LTSSGQPFNSVLLNLYRAGRDSVSWHADNEPGLGGRGRVLIEDQRASAT
jgi:alkylated DNA repair dioxygenase AlkB